jgi:hypothetical protein
MGRKKYERQCERKFRHENYLTAIHHAMQLSKDDIVIYPCGICNGLHLGHGFARYAAHCRREHDRLIFSLQRDIHRVREIGRSQEDNVRQLEEEIERLLTEYF